tara:strand:+ start:1755 stop:2528 length:774 start_codon:yes stop_codon:yes gene_type:complete
MTKTIAIANQKGGVGKTTTAINLATAMCSIGKKVLIIDLDPQSNATTGLGITSEEIKKNIYNLMVSEKYTSEYIYKTIIPTLDIIPATMDLAGAEVELVNIEDREKRLKKILNQINEYDNIMIDCPPALGLLTINGLVASDSVIIPLQCEFFALEGLSSLMQTIDSIKGSYNASLEVQGVVLTMYDKRNLLSSLVEKDVREHLGNKVYSTIIPRNVRISEAPSHGKPVLIYDVGCTGSRAYIELAKEVIKQQNGEQK